MLTFGPNKSRFSRGGNIINKLSSKVYQKKKLSNIPDNEDLNIFIVKKNMMLENNFGKLCLKSGLSHKRRRKKKKEKKPKIKKEKKKNKKNDI